MITLNVGVTGHRDLRAGDIPRIEEQVGRFFRELQQRFPDLPLRLLTPLAEGADQLSARVALSMDIPIIAVLPMKQWDYESDFDTAESLMTFKSLLRKAEKVITLPRAPDRLGNSQLQDMSPRQRQYAQLGVFLSNHSHILLALWDGKNGSDPGGTGQVVRYHRTAVMAGFENEITHAELLAENENDLVFHVVCARESDNGEPASGLVAGETSWLSSLNDGTRFSDLPDDYATLLGSVQQFARDRDSHRQLIDSNTDSLLNEIPVQEVPASVRLTNRLFSVADTMAIHYQKRVDLSLKATYSLAVVMGLVFLLYSESDGAAFLVLIFLALFFGGVALNVMAQRRQWHRKYLDYRVLAEGLRVQLYWNLAGVVDSTSADFAYDNFLQKQDIDLGWIRHVMRIISLQRERGSEPDPAWVDWVIDQWIGQPDTGMGQLAYYTHKQQENSRRYRITQRLGALSLWAGISIAFVLYLLGDDGLESWREVLLILMGVFPLIAGVWDAYSHKKAEKELIKQYHFMSKVFGRARRLLDSSQDIAFQRRVLKALGQAALEEGSEWLLMQRERPPEHGGLQ